MTLEWKGFSAEQIRFSIQHNKNKERLLVLNENAYPGWHISVLREGTRQDIPLVKNDLGLIAFRLPVGDSLVELRYRRSIYKWSNIVALGGIGLVAMLIFIVSMPLQRFKSKKDKVTISEDGQYEIIETPLGKIKRKRKITKWLEKNTKN